MHLLLLLLFLRIYYPKPMYTLVIASTAQYSRTYLICTGNHLLWSVISPNGITRTTTKYD